MTEFETTSLVVRQSALATQQAALLASWAIPAVAGLIGVIQAGVVVWGIRVMRAANGIRSAEGAQRAKREDQRHTESMAAIREIIERTGEAPMTFDGDLRSVLLRVGSSIVGANYAPVDLVITQRELIYFQELVKREMLTYRENTAGNRFRDVMFTYAGQQLYEAMAKVQTGEDMTQADTSED